MLQSISAESIVTTRRPIQVLHSAETAAEVQRFGRAKLDRLGIKKLQAKEHVFCEGDDRNHVFQIEDGVVTIYRMLKDGRRQIIDFAFPGDFIGLGTTREHLFSAEATAATTVRCYSTTELEETAKVDASLALQLYKAVSQELSAARALLEHTPMPPEEIVKHALGIAGDLCIYTNQQHTIEVLE